MSSILTLNNISPVGLSRLPADRYTVGDSVENPDAILLRSFKMHEMDLPPSLKAVGRAGAGVNNIPVDKLTMMGIPVFNAPAANANAVKELVIAGLLLACRNLCDAWDYTRQLSGSDAELDKMVESGKKQFSGFELPGKTIGVIGLGAIGRSVANVCVDLGMKVVGFDPMLTVEGAWQLSSNVEPVESIEELLSRIDFVSFHVPKTSATENMINKSNIGLLNPGASILNFARDGIVDDAIICQALRENKLRRYVTDFPNSVVAGCPGVLALPHLGASTTEAEDNSAVMVADQVRAFLEDGVIRNSVNFPKVTMQRGSPYRLIVANANLPNMLGQISTAMAEAGLNIHDMINQSRGDIAYTVVDVDSQISESVVNQVAMIEGVMMARTLTEY